MATDKVTYRVIGGFEVAGTPNGETITRRQLEEYDGGLVNIDALIMGGHIEVDKDDKSGKPEADKPGTKKPETGE